MKFPVAALLAAAARLRPCRCAAGSAPAHAIKASSWILIDQASGQVIAGHDADQSVEPASLTKLMTAYAVFHALQDGKLKLDTPVPISEHAWRAEGSRTFVDVGIAGCRSKYCCRA